MDTRQGRRLAVCQRHGESSLGINLVQLPEPPADLSTEDVVVGQGNVLMYGGCKQNGGNTQTCSNNLILYPGVHNRSAAGNTCLSANKFADSFYENNDCIADRYMGPVPESAKAAEGSYLGARNRYYMPPAFPDGCLVQHGNTSAVQSCPEGSQHGNLTWGKFNSFTNYSAHGNDDGSVVLPPPSLMEIVRMAEEKLSMASVAALKADDGSTALNRGGARLRGDQCRQPSGDPCLHLLSTVFGSHMVKNTAFP